MDAKALKVRFDSEEFEREWHTEEPLGAFCSKRGTRFALWAPTAQAVTLMLYADCEEWEPRERIAMTRGERGVWYYETARPLDGVYYGYDVTVDGVTRWTGDPYARACGANGWRSMVIDLARTNPPGWEHDRPPKRQAEDVIYEIHVKDFTCDESSGIPAEYRGKYRALTFSDASIGGKGRRKTGLAYLRDLGVTHVQLMPVYDYGSVDETGDPDAFNWGYDPINYNVPEGSYSSDPRRGEVRIREFKEMVAAMHANGLRVIMDVVYNHTYHFESTLFKTAPWYYQRCNEVGTPSNGSGCGSEIATERSMCARYILESVLYWAREYHIDGFRFDLMGLMDVPLMSRIRKELDTIYGEGEKLVYGEPWSGGRSAERRGTALCHKGNLRMLPLGVGAFCDMTRDLIKGSVFDKKHPGFVNGGELSAQALASCVRGWAGEGYPYAAPSQTISYLSAHDNWTLWDKLVYTLRGGRRFAPVDEALLRANRLAAAMLFCCQGRLFMLSGEEFARTKLGDGNSYRSSLRVNRMDWKRAHRNHELVRYYQGLIALRKCLPGLCDKSETAGDRLLEAMDAEHGLAVIRLDNTGEGSAYDQLLLAFNTQEKEQPLALPQGMWCLLADGEDSFAFRRAKALQGEAKIAPVSALILGRRAGVDGNL